MVNIIGYDLYPNKKEFEEFYLNQNLSQRELCKIYGCTKKRIQKWILYFGLELRQKGGGNNRKYNPSKSQILRLIQEGNTREEIAKSFGMQKSTLAQWMKRFNLYSRDFLRTPEYDKYRNKVRWLTERNYANNKEQINPFNYPRTISNVDNGYQLDHRISIRYGFDNNISPEEISNVDNLQMLPWRENIIKGKKNG